VVAEVSSTSSVTYQKYSEHSNSRP